MSGAADRIGSVGDGSNVRSYEKWVSEGSYTRLIAADPQPMMEMLRNAEFIRGLLQSDYKACIVNLRRFGGVHRDESFEALMPVERPYFVLFPGASWDGKRWPLSSFHELAERIHRRTGWQGVICGGPTDRSLGEKLRGEAKDFLLDWSGRTTLSQMAGVLAGAKLLVSNDTSAVHIAAAVGTPAVCLMGGGHFGRFLPYQIERANEQPLPVVVDFKMPCYGCNWECIYDLSQIKTAPCVGNISVDTAWSAVLGLPVMESTPEVSSPKL